jgi:tripartite-type tricarboxylate transporter receptor subunit TctC
VGAHHQALRSEVGLTEFSNAITIMQRRQLISFATQSIALSAVSLPATTAFSQQKPIRLIVPYAAGGPIDVTARLIAEQVKTSLSTVIIDNKPGAGGNIGADLIAKAAPDGATIGIAALATHAINPWLYSKMPFDAGKDFAPITQMLRVPNVLVMNADTAARLKISTLQDFLQYAKANPAKLNYGSGGNGSGGHLAGEMFKQRASVFAVHIPYNGGNPAQLALLSGQVDFNLDNLATAAPNIRSGKLKALAVTTLKRSSAILDLPTLAEAMPNLFSGFAVDTWWGLVAPAGTPADIVAKLNTGFTAALNSPETKTRYASLMAEPSPSTSAEFAAFMQAERAKYEKPVKASGARID